MRRLVVLSVAPLMTRHGRCTGIIKHEYFCSSTITNILHMTFGLCWLASQLHGSSRFYTVPSFLQFLSQQFSHRKSTHCVVYFRGRDLIRRRACISLEQRILLPSTHKMPVKFIFSRLHVLG